METRVTLRPGEKGTKALVAEYGRRLICVRYRYDASVRVRYKTVELVIEQVPWDPGAPVNDDERKAGRPPCMVAVRVAYQDRGLQQRIRQLGGRWIRKLGLWVLPLSAAKRLKLQDRLVPVPDVVEPAPEVYHEKPTGINQRGRGVYHDVYF